MNLDTLKYVYLSPGDILFLGSSGVGAFSSCHGETESFGYSATMLANISKNSIKQFKSAMQMSAEIVEKNASDQPGHVTTTFDFASC